MPTDRHEQIVSRVNQNGFASVRELSELLQISEATVRRDLELLEESGLVARTHGGARAASPSAAPAAPPSAVLVPAGSVADRVDVLVTTSVDANVDRALLDRAAQRNIPVIAESVLLPGALTVVSVDNYQAAAALGRWAGAHVRRNYGGQANVLDLTFTLANTQARSQGFFAGLRELVPAARQVLSLNAGSVSQIAYQLTRDVLDVHPEINVIFAINDATASGARRACKDHGVDPHKLVLLSFGIEGDTQRNLLAECDYCLAGLAMFPEIVGPACVEAALWAYNGRPLPAHVVTPHAVLTRETLPQYYSRSANGWELNWAHARQHLSIPLPISDDLQANGRLLPARIGFVVPFSEHEWYRNLAETMRQHAGRLGIELEVIDAEQQRRVDQQMREREIARAAAALVAPGDVVLLDSGPICACLAEELVGRQDVTVITNSAAAFEALRDASGIALVVIGGQYRRSSGSFSGPTAEMALRELRADKVFLAASGVSLEFGLSHHSLAEVATKQAMTRAAREVIALADSARFGQESVAQIAPLNVVSKLVTDAALAASTRLELSKMGIEVIIARA